MTQQPKETCQRTCRGHLRPYKTFSKRASKFWKIVVVIRRSWRNPACQSSFICSFNSLRTLALKFSDTTSKKALKVKRNILIVSGFGRKTCKSHFFFLFLLPDFPMDGPDMCRTDWLYVNSLYYICTSDVRLSNTVQLFFLSYVLNRQFFWNWCNGNPDQITKFYLFESRGSG